MSTIAFVNQKGGVGKTSLCFHLAGAFASGGSRVLLVDNDPQASLTQVILGPSATGDLDKAETVEAIYRGSTSGYAALARPTEIEGIDLLPGSIYLSAYNLPDEEEEHLPPCLLAEALRGVDQAYDLVLIDNPSTLLACSLQAARAADGVVIPVMGDDLGMHGISPVLAMLGRVRIYRPGLTLLGIVMSRYRHRLSIQRMYAEMLVDAYGGDAFRQSVPDYTDYAQAVLQRQPITQAKPHSAAAHAIESLAREINTRIGDRLKTQVRRPIREVI